MTKSQASAQDAPDFPVSRGPNFEKKTALVKLGHPQVLWGGISGALAAWLTTPFDVIKTRVMTATELMTFSQALRSGCGAVGLLAGAGPRSAWWFCVSSVFFGTYERLRSSFQEKLES